MTEVTKQKSINYTMETTVGEIASVMRRDGLVSYYNKHGEHTFRCTLMAASNTSIICSGYGLTQVEALIESLNKWASRKDVQ